MNAHVFASEIDINSITAFIRELPGNVEAARLKCNNGNWVDVLVNGTETTKHTFSDLEPQSRQKIEGQFLVNGDWVYAHMGVFPTVQKHPKITMAGRRKGGGFKTRQCPDPPPMLEATLVSIEVD